MKHRYLFTLEITPLEVGKTYNELPSHLTLMSRFLTDMPPDTLINAFAPLFKASQPIALSFGETIKLGPKNLTVHTVENSNELKQLHNTLLEALNSLNVTYEYPDYIAAGHKPHVTKREDVQFNDGDKYVAQAAYLIEVVDGKRAVRTRFRLGE